MEATRPFLSVNKDLQERCNEWIETSQSGPVYNENFRTDQLLGENDQEYIDTDTEFDSVSECGSKRRKKGFKLKDEVFQLECEWRDCDFQTQFMGAFVKHVANHMTELEIREKESGPVYVCLWTGCMYENGKTTDIMRHVNYHSFHTKIKCIGTNVRKRVQLPKCHREKEWKNIIDVMGTHTCEWQGCGEKPFNNFQLLLYHVSAHIEQNPRGNKISGGVKCQWGECTNKYPSLYRLREHVRAHTNEKVIACPDCGTMFANNTKFHDHCKRQIPLEVQGFQCSHCNKFYPTKNILKEHMRNHVFHYKCPICSMTCDSPSALQRHQLYRHSDERKFSCKMCEHKAKSRQDLEYHLTSHTTGSNFLCNVEGCQYSCKNSYTLDRHIEKVHQHEVRWYCCHECPLRYRKSYRLTKHLIETHRLQQISGHKRFQYILSDDGNYRLQTMRYESVDDDNNIEDSESVATKNPSQTGTNDNEITKTSKGIITEEGLIVDGLMEQDVPVDDSTLPCQSIYITIDEIDEHGNIINTRVVKAQDATELPMNAEPLALSVIDD